MHRDVRILISVRRSGDEDCVAYTDAVATSHFDGKERPALDGAAIHGDASDHTVRSRNVLQLFKGFFRARAEDPRCAKQF